MFSYGWMFEDLPFRGELWDDGWIKRLETLATAGDFLTAKAAFEAAVQRRPSEAILLCDRARIVMRSKES
jgi:cytochrome c-type biogenesis protein CcmH/NrfG